jgi:hypothetical protein
MVLQTSVREAAADQQLQAQRVKATHTARLERCHVLRNERRHGARRCRRTRATQQCRCTEIHDLDNDEFSVTSAGAKAGAVAPSLKGRRDRLEQDPAAVRENFRYSSFRSLASELIRVGSCPTHCSLHCSCRFVRRCAPHQNPTMADQPAAGRIVYGAINPEQACFTACWF